MIKGKKYWLPIIGPNGIGYRVIRTHMDSCDFSLGNYSTTENGDDKEMKSFSLARDEELIYSPSGRQ